MSKVSNRSRGGPECSPLNSWGVGKGASLFLRLLHFTFDVYLKMRSVKQSGIKYHFFGMIRSGIEPQTIGEHSTH